MLNVFFATKKNMSQAWTKQGKRLAVTKLAIKPNVVIGEKKVTVKTDASDVNSLRECRILEVGSGDKKFKNMSKPMRTRLSKLGVETGLRQVSGVRTFSESDSADLGAKINASEIFQAGDIVKVQGTSKGRGFAGGMKRHGFHGGPKTHGQSDRARAGGSVGQHTEPGRVFPGKRMPGHYGVETKTVTGLTVLFVSDDELWLSGPVPGSINGLVRVEKTGALKKAPALNMAASGLPEEKVEETKVEEAAPTEAAAEIASTEEVSEVECTCTDECASGYNPNCTCQNDECHCREQKEAAAEETVSAEPTEPAEAKEEK